jgi:transposase-like protein
MRTPDNLDLQQFFRLIPNEDAARRYLEAKRWNGTPVCVECGSTNVAECKDHRPLPYRCRDCRKHFSVRGGSVLAGSRLALQKWLQIIYLLTSLREGIPSLQLAQALGAGERTTCELAHCIHNLYRSRKSRKKPQNPRQYRVIEPIGEAFDAAVVKLVADVAPGDEYKPRQWWW